MKKLLCYGMGAAVALSSCHAAKQVGTEEKVVENVGGELTLPSPLSVSSPTSRTREPQVFIYKLKNADCYNRVPVMMSADRETITSYPAPTDLLSGGSLRLPTRLADGYLLDNKGIGPLVAFLDYTYEEYSALRDVPSMSELLSHIMDKNPLATWRYCGYRSEYTDIVAQLNKLIEAEGTEN